MGHGHVTPNPDGSKARCGGPVMCSKCAQELAQLQRIESASRMQAVRETLDPWERRERERITWIADATKEPQPIGMEVWEAQQQEIQRLARRVAELTQYNTEKDERVRELVAVEKELQARVRELEENERKTLELLKDGHSAHVLILRGDIAVSRRQLAHLLGDAYQELFAKLEEPGTQPESPHNAPRLPQEPPVPVSVGDLSSGQEYGGLGDLPEWDRGWADAMAGKRLADKSFGEGTDLTTLEKIHAYAEGWEIGKRRYVSEQGRKP